MLLLVQVLGIVTGGTNTAIGPQALYDLTSGANNISVGYRSAYELTTGARNTAIGVFALKTQILKMIILL